MSLKPHAIVLLACATALPGCATESGDKTKADEVPGNASDSVVIDAHAGGETRLRRGQLLAIALDSNASTGYAWEIVEDGSPVLESAPVPVSTAPATPPMPGAGGTSRWRYRAVQTGTTTLRLVYRRSWEKGVEPVRTATYRVVVE
jgi:inhibitor of cysteine peptidase